MSVLTEQQITVLDLAVEDSYGLWEVGWRFRDMYPSLSREDAHASAQRAAVELLRSGYIECVSSSNSPSPGIPLTRDEALAALREGTHWAGPASDGTQFRVHATERGEHAYRMWRPGA
jgi:hypothetical protein